ncbi:GNAT family N-acetyltransferase [Vibrio sp. TH_r3]|uniref:GNAT family N-acetyltransferase n=1 Tax=Vibrio sp. TH_r3 TaxID=3082084 RepID=UPI0029529B22|nr:GNAT family N-acetyltransferase [Vibrio sp. TH_r3]MDV7104657.1 GNAT family N-acetyltransferase [Vibrio sp. TH_r3]
MKIMQAGIEDLELITPLFDLYRVFYAQVSDVTTAHKFIKSRIENQESVIFLAVNNEGQGVGFTQLYPSFSSVSAARIWVLNDLYVADEARRQGIAKKLMNVARDFAANDKAKGLALETSENNITAQRLYESLGYEKELATYHYFLNLN